MTTPRERALRLVEDVALCERYASIESCRCTSLVEEAIVAAVSEERAQCLAAVEGLHSDFAADFAVSPASAYRRGLCDGSEKATARIRERGGP